MSRTRLSVGFAFCAALVLAGCSEPGTAPPDEVEALSTPSFKSASVGTDAGSFIVMAKGNSLPRNLAKAVEAAGGSITATIPEIGVALVTLTEPSLGAALAAVDGVRSVLPNLTVQGVDPGTHERSVKADAFGDPPASGDDDFFFDLQWGHTAVQAPDAWNAGARGAGVRVAMLDSGIDATHPDLSPNLNSGLSASFVPGEAWWLESGDVFNHGSHTAGTVAAADNGYGTIGIAPEAEIVAIKVLSEYTGSGSFFGIMQGIVYAAVIDADLINMSIGGFVQRRGYKPDVGANEVAELMVAMGRATSFAFQSGTTIIASAGNESVNGNKDKDLVHLPSGLPHVITVSATAPQGWGADPSTDLDVPASYTNYGQSVITMAGPGGDWSYAFAPGGFDLCTVAGITNSCYVFDYVFSTGGDGAWYWSTGTSMAAPHVTGVAALIIGQSGGSMNPAQVEAALRRSADDLGKPGNDPWYGRGRVNAYNAVN